MEIKELLEAFAAWLEEREITDVEIQEKAGDDGDFSAIFFPVEEDPGYLPYEICAILRDGAPLALYVDYCDIPDVDELELYRFLNELNEKTILKAIVDEGHLLLSYSIPMEYITTREGLSDAFFAVWDAMDHLRDDITDAFGIDVEDGEEDLEEDIPADAETDGE